MPAILLFYLFVFHLGATASLSSQQKTELVAETPPVKRSDDVDNADLTVLVQQQAAVVQQQAAMLQQQAAAIHVLQTKVTSLESKGTHADTKIAALERQARKQGKLAAYSSARRGGH